MWIEIEPADFFMFRIGLFFSESAPDPEDAWVREYLTQHGLEPRRQARIERDGEPVEVLQFGQCYLGNHALAIRDLRKRGIERSILLEAVPEILQNAGYPLEAAGLDPAGSEGRALVAQIAERVHPEAQFAQADDGRVGVALDPELVIAAYRDIGQLGSGRAPAE